jgi:paraquat-inducible protein B
MIRPDDIATNGAHDGDGANWTGGGTEVLPPRPVARMLPRPVIRHRRWPALLVWLVPLAVAVGAGYYFLRLYRELGPDVTISFTDATGVKVGETPLTVHGVRIGTVESVNLAPDNVHAQVHVRFQRGTALIANTNTVFYMVHPDVSGGNIQGLSTIVSGPYITAIVGNGGEPSTRFDGLDGPPVMRGAGIRVVVHAARVDHLAIDAPVYYRGMQVGVVQDIRLSGDSTGVNLTAFIWLRYAKLLRSDSVFWPLSSAEVKGGLLGGIQVQLGTLRTLLGGGIAFATPESLHGRLAQDGSQFQLAVDGPRPEWLAWAPRIPLGPDPVEDVESGHGAQQEQGVLQSTLRIR